MISSRTKVLAQVGACLVTISVTAVPSVLMAAPPSGAFVVAAVFPPWWSASRIQLAVDPVGAVSSKGRLPTVVTVYGGPGVERRLKAAGAWLILDPRLVGCGPRAEAGA
jgi:hypothetical protein